jgi:hypothetical protein
MRKGLCVAYVAALLIQVPLLMFGVIMTVSPNQRAIGTVYDVQPQQKSREDGDSTYCYVAYRYSLDDHPDIEFSGVVSAPCFPRPALSLAICYSRIKPSRSAVVSGGCTWSYIGGVLLTAVAVTCIVTLAAAFAMTALLESCVAERVDEAGSDGVAVLPRAPHVFPPQMTTARVELGSAYAWDLARARPITSGDGDRYVIVKHPS